MHDNKIGRMTTLKKILCLILALAVAFGAMAYAEGAQGDGLEAMLSGMSLRDKVAQMMVASFRVWQEVPPEGEDMPEEEPPKENITRLNDAIRDMVSRNHFGGILLYGQNIVDAEQTLRLIVDYQATNQAGGGLPQIVFMDQEGGSVNRIPYATQGIGNMALGATGDPENARTTAAMLAEEMRLLGIQADFAPVVDVNNNPLNPVIGIRSFSEDPQAVAAFGQAYIQGLHDAGTISTAKHFPGHGDTDTDSHTGAPVINKTYEELKARELIPYKAAIDAGVDMIMTAHIQYPQIEKGTYTSISTGESIHLCLAVIPAHKQSCSPAFSYRIYLLSQSLRRGGHHQADDRRGRGPADPAARDGYQPVPADPNLCGHRGQAGGKRRNR